MKTPGRLKVLVIGGYGTFGGRLCDLLADEPRLTLIVAGRSLAKAEAFCKARTAAAATLIPAKVDRDGGLVADIAACDPDIVVDASGPWQDYGADAYAVVAAALAAGANYLDLADGSQFVQGIGAHDAAARAAGRFVLSGASSFPVLTAAVTRALSADLTRVDSVTAGIAPSPYAGVGLNVVRAIASYAGKPVRLRRGGAPAVGRGLIDSKTRVITVPGHVPLPPVRFSLVDVPDLAVLPLAWPSLRDVWMGAGPTPAILHRALTLLAEGVRIGAFRSLVPLAPLMNWATNHIRWGEHRGGMFIEVAGLGAGGEALTRRWHMLAEGDAGPFIPSMAVEIVIRACLAGRVPDPGARPAGREVTLADYEERFARRGIVTATLAGSTDPALPIYRQLLGAAYGRLSGPVQAVHDMTGRIVLKGASEVRRGRGTLSRLIARIVGFPPEGDAVPVTVTLSREGDREVWARDFDGHRFRSLQYLGVGRNEGLLVERFGPIAFAMAVVVRDGRLHLVQRRWTFLGVPMPRWMLPTGTVCEHDADGRFNFHVEIVLPIVGLVVAYRGWLVPTA